MGGIPKPEIHGKRKSETMADLDLVHENKNDHPMEYNQQQSPIYHAPQNLVPSQNFTMMEQQSTPPNNPNFLTADSLKSIELRRLHQHHHHN